MCSDNKLLQQKGFSLVEAAIVLGVVGLVIGGIWTTASEVQRSNRRQEISRNMLEMQIGLEKFTQGISYTNGDSYRAYTQVVWSERPQVSIPSVYNVLFDSGIQDASGLYYAVSTANYTPEYNMRDVAGLDRADCIWMGHKVYTLAGLSPSEPAPDVVISNSTVRTNWCCGYYDDLITWMTTNCAATGNSVQIGMYRSSN